jgi:Cation transport ATPase
MDEPAPGVSIRSAVAGRERWEVDELRGAPRYAAAIESSLCRELWVRRAWANAATGRLLIAYDRGIDRAAVHERVVAALNTEPFDRSEWSVWRKSWPKGFTVTSEETEIRKANARLAVSGTILSAIIAKRMIFGAGAFATGSPLIAVSALFGIVSGYRSLQRALEDPTTGRAAPGAALLHAIGLGLLVATESIEGVGTMAILHASELVETRALVTSRRRLLAIEGGIIPRTSMPRREVPEYDVHSVSNLAAAAVYLATHNVSRAAAMIIAASPDAVPDAHTMATGFAAYRSNKAGALFRNPKSFTTLPGRVAVVFDGVDADETIIDSLQQQGIDPVVQLSGGMSDEEIEEVMADLRGGRRRIAVVASTAGAALRGSDLAVAIVGQADDDALAAADIVLTDNGIEKLPFMVDLIRDSSRVLVQNEWLAAVVGGIGLVAAALGKLPPNSAATFHNRMRLALQLNSARVAFTRSGGRSTRPGASAG